ncbi:AraC family transcriptional regulator [Prevotella sp. 10(H)]|uniref:helix-turn-helix domain-containing protein n=1 Tax=Prevotella sp. 10(H) TaxID=1158294 RepID=UPI0004A76C17|nr:AraC family transcriptional regulator [Prevotella sp. 10(H)]
MEEKHIKITLDKVDKNAGDALLKNYIISDSSKIPEYINMDETFIFDGLILGVCIKGNGHLKVNHHQYEIKEDTITCLFPNNISKMIQASEDFLVELMFFSQDYISSLPLRMDKDIFLRMNENPVIELKKEVIYNILELHAIIIKQYNENLTFKEEIIKALIYALMLEIASYYKTENDSDVLKKSSREDELTKRFFVLLIDNFRTEKKLSFYADKLCLTANYLSSIIKKVTGNSFQEWIQIILITEIKNLLKTTDLSILQISEDLNFANPSFFGRFFKQYTGMTPLKYRNS